MTSSDPTRTLDPAGPVVDMDTAQPPPTAANKYQPLSDPLADSHDFLHSLPPKPKDALKEIDTEFSSRYKAILADIHSQLEYDADAERARVQQRAAQRTADKRAIDRDLERTLAAAAGDVEQLARAKKQAAARTHELYVQGPEDLRARHVEMMAMDETVRWRYAAIAWVEQEAGRIAAEEQKGEEGKEDKEVGRAGGAGEVDEGV